MLSGSDIYVDLNVNFWHCFYSIVVLHGEVWARCGRDY